MSFPSAKDGDGWVNEFLLCQIVSGSEGLRSFLRDADSCTAFEVVEVLLSIWNKIADGEVTEDILQKLEKLEQYLRSENAEIPNSMKRAYCAVAVECTAKYALTFSVDNTNYVNALARVWLGTVSDLVRKNSLMTSMELLEWGKKLADAVSSRTIRKSIIIANTRNKAISSLKWCIRDLWRSFGTSFIGIIGSRLEKTDEPRNSPDRDTENADSQRKDNKSPGVEDTFEVLDRQLRKLRGDMSEFEALVSDPLPDALRAADVLRLRLSENDTVERQRKEHMAADEAAENREDSDDTSIEGSSVSRKHNLRSPRTFVISPLKQPEVVRNVVYRRPKIAWTNEEICILREGVARFGKAWKTIKAEYPIELARRTEVDLKDKWRVECNH